MALLVSGCSSDPDVPPEEPSIKIVTFNTGTTEGRNGQNNAGYGEEQGALSDMYYGNGLAWQAAVDDTRLFFERIDADIVAFQEIFFSDDCPSVPAEARAGFVCESWQAGDPTVAQVVLGEGWQVVCHLGKPDKCLAVNRRLGTFRGCDEDLCLDGLDGAAVPDCGGGSRIGRGVIDLDNGGVLTVTSIHGTSGIEPPDRECRVEQFKQVFEDLGDGEPAANGERNVILGDLNTDPGRTMDFDESAQLFNTYVGAAERFHFITEVGPDVTPTYTLFNIDHVISDALTGNCVHPGVAEGEPPVTDIAFFDHKPAVCKVDVP
jgi:hypothetical protein